MYHLVWLSDEKHLPDIAERLYQISEDGYPMGSPWTANMFVVDLDNEDTKYLLVKLNNQIIGYAGLSLGFDTLDITNIVILTEHKEKKLGSLILKELKSYSLNNNYKEIFIEVRLNLKNLINWYEGNGFLKMNTRKKYYHHPVEDAQVMSLKIL